QRRDWRGPDGRRAHEGPSPQDRGRGWRPAGAGDGARGGLPSARMTRQEILLALALLFLLGVGATAARVLEARRTGLSLRLQVFIPLAATTLILSAMFAVIVIDRFTARASLFATRAAEDEARVIAELAARTPRESLRPVLQAFTRSAIDTDVAV